MKHLKKFTCILLSCIMIILMLPVSAFAAVSVDTDAETSLSISLKDDETTIEGAEFKIYRVAGISSSGRYNLAGDFTGYSSTSEITADSASEWNYIAKELEAYVSKNNIESDYSGTTDENGALVFDKLDTGLYLVLGTKYVGEEYTYTFTPSLVSLPNRNQNDVWEYDVAIAPKYSKEENPPVIETITREIQKAWDDEGHESARPKDVIVRLYADGVEKETITLNENNGWFWKREDLPKNNEDGSVIQWTVSEESSDLYEVKVEEIGVTFKITNTYKLTPPPETVSRSIIKVWDDKGYEDKRPESVTVKLFENQEVYETIILNDENKWQWSKEDLPKFDENDKEIEWTISEVSVAGYSGSVKFVDDTFILTNKYIPDEPQTTERTVVKVWDDGCGASHPAEVTVELYADGELYDDVKLSNKNGWRHTFTDLPKFDKDGAEIKWSVKEVSVKGYETFISEKDGVFVILNKKIIEPPVITTSRTIVKRWNDCGIHPSGVTVNLYADGRLYDSARLTAENGWTWTRNDLPLFDSNGRLIVYTIAELPVPGYTTTYNQFGNVFVVTNTLLKPPTPPTEERTVVKVWDDCGNEANRPEEITVNLYKNGSYYDSVKLSKDNSWRAVFSELPMYENGRRIFWSVSEEPVENYTTKIEYGWGAFVITNTYVEPPVPPEEKTSRSIVKVWNDCCFAANRPKEVVVNLYKNGELYEQIKLNASNNWSWNSDDLPKYENGKEIVWTIAEEGFDDYEVTIEQCGLTFVMTNTYIPKEPEKEERTVIKKWNDAGNEENRPSEITVVLYKNGFYYDSAKLSEENDWQVVFRNLPQYDFGRRNFWFVSELPVENYSTEIGYAFGTFVITNTYEEPPVPPEETTSRAIEKVWDDEEYISERPEEVVVYLYKNGEQYEKIVLNEANGWSWRNDELPKYEDGKEIVWTIAEEAFDNYEVTIDSKEETFVVTNTYVPVEPEKTSVSVLKKWKNDEESSRPSTIKVEILADGEVYKTVTLSKESNWFWEDTNLPKFDEAGNEIKWSVKEVSVEGYDSSIKEADGAFVITNTFVPTPVPETVKREIQKVWKDKGYESKRPASISISLLADGKQYKEIVLNERNGWSWSSNDLPKYNEKGEEIVWSVDEPPIRNYTMSKEVNGIRFIVTNTYEEELPQTGQLWWPIPVLVLLGIVLIVLGLIRRRNYNA